MSIILKIKKWYINCKQRKINKQFESKGLTDDLLEKQIAINIQRNELDLVDDSFVDDEGFVQ